MTTNTASAATNFAHNINEVRLTRTPIVAKEHRELQQLHDVLGRMHQHHALLQHGVCDKWNLALMVGLCDRLLDIQTPSYFANTHFYYLDASNGQWQSTLAELASINHFTVIAINHFNTEHIEKLLPFVHEPHLRFIVFAVNESVTIDPGLFEVIKIAEPTQTDKIALLRTYQNELENFHDVIISEDVFPFAIDLAKNYLNSHQELDQALNLIDSACVRSHMTDRTDHSHKPIIAKSLLRELVSNWCDLPPNFFQPGKLQAQRISESLQRHVFGQDTALKQIARLLEHSKLHLPNNRGPLSLLFYGRENTGKTTTALSLTEYFQGNTEHLLRVKLDKTGRLADLTTLVKNAEENLINFIIKKPYSIVLFENMLAAHPNLLAEIQELMAKGFAISKEGKLVTFGNTILIFSATISTASLPYSPAALETTEIDLMDLVLNKPQEPSSGAEHPSTRSNFNDDSYHILQSHFDSAFLNQCHLIAFMPLTAYSIDKIIRLKMGKIVQFFKTNYHLEIAFTSEAIKFLNNISNQYLAIEKTVENVLEDYLYSLLAHEVFLQSENKHRGKQLSIQLNDTGQVLRCTVVTNTESLIYVR